MQNFALTPYFHPTTVVFVDDNESFLRSIELEVPRAWTPKLFTDPHQALEYLQTPEELPPLMERCFSMQRSSREAIIRLDLDLIEQEIKHIGRFHRNSVVVADYSMPSMNGLELCERLTDPHLRRAMLTGVADEKQAVEAFNSGLLHQFLPKHAGQSISEIFDFVDRLQQQYFEQYTARLKNTLSIDPPRFLTDARLAKFLARFMTRNRLIEYYLAGDPPGLLMVKRNGEICRLVILQEDDLQAQADYAARYQAPERLIAALRSGRRIACLTGEMPEDDYSQDDFDWEDKVLKGKSVVGDKGTYYLGVWRNMPGDIDYDPKRSSYDAYLSTL
jgi:CheY-like chemotaxis protein